MKRWGEQAAQWIKQQEEAKEVDMSEDVSDEQIAELMEKMMKASAEDVPKIAEQLQEMLRRQGSKANKRSNSRARATKREADEATGEEEAASNKKAKAESRWVPYKPEQPKTAEEEAQEGGEQKASDEAETGSRRRNQIEDESIS